MDRTFNLLSLGLIHAPWEEKRSPLTEAPIKAKLSEMRWFRHCSQRKGEWMSVRQNPRGMPHTGSREMAGGLEEMSLAVAGEHLLVQLACP